jgi:hypothetical protein
MIKIFVEQIAISSINCRKRERNLGKYQQLQFKYGFTHTEIFTDETI